jgi:hypothetical protein
LFGARSRTASFSSPTTQSISPLYQRAKIHAGLVCLNVAPGLMSLDIQTQLFLLALDRIGNAEPINEAFEVTLAADGAVLVERYALPSD